MNLGILSTEIVTATLIDELLPMERGARKETEGQG